MKTSTVLLLLTCSALALANTRPSDLMSPASVSNVTPSTPAANTTTTTAKTTTTTAKTTTTTAKTTTTTAKTTTTTAKTTTPTAKPTTTTTAKPTTTTAKPTTTTTAKPTTTTAKPTTTIPPTTTKAPMVTNSTVGNYTLENGAQRCLMVQMELRVRLVSAKANGTFLLLPNITSTSGECNDTHAALTLRVPQVFNLTMSFNKNLTTKTTFVSNLGFNLTYDFSKKLNAAVTYKAENSTVHLFSAKTGQSYSCRKESLFMGNGLYLDIDQDRMQAFNFSKSNEFGTADPCPADQNNYRVAIAVGITLLVLVVVVVVAYLLARKKRTDGYQSL